MTAVVAPHTVDRGDSQGPALHRDAIPEAGWPFLGLAQRLGVYEDKDEIAREAIDRLSDSDKRAVLFFRSHLPVEVDQWLRGDEAMASPPSLEYAAFSCLYLAAAHLEESMPNASWLRPRALPSAPNAPR